MSNGRPWPVRCPAALSRVTSSSLLVAGPSRLTSSMAAAGVRLAVPEKPHQPIPIKLAEKVADIRVQHPVHFLPVDPGRQRVQRIMRPAPWPEPVGKSPEVRLVHRVQHLRHAYKIPVPDPYRPGEISVAEAARRAGCSTSVIYHWIHTGQLTARRGSAGRFCIPWNQQLQADCQHRIEQSGHLNPAARRTKPRQRR